jgi:hypothetical protein
MNTTYMHTLTYHAQVDFNSCGDPERVRVPCLVVFSEQATVDKPGADYSCNRDDEPKSKEYGNGNALSSRHAQLLGIS